jgi:hypothetical protein
MIVLNRSFLNREYILIHVLKALASIISMSVLSTTLDYFQNAFFDVRLLWTGG